ncbi:cytochrome C [Anabaena cylindrica FACHB-243]|uniref:Dihem cytochrome c n=1 Tax=Anabaena cylindrica (strain ATCC 27899 / PCC 7122) TaxID=272123 RepID=K9ZPH8_ANACC|nr:MULTISPECIES: dihem cytochrome c [Anabaena]AFZ60457.1 Dihem cytochrome c [Anabaena cylindrica PCC 7122]MBD2416443.1 cytochrome C [Anabaena cylindrica FACHB-243]MBY5284845.1 cytochrome C [Anabaena sp. CCAP 1446/1C]MBY5310371.1 cytochrome C [Anabaena sp. CCAP 1446/1C]MCM2408496.1 cytochrome C [Anabaena sp. CCAP 1446/1C]
MSNLVKSKSPQRRLKRQLFIVMLVIFAWSIAIGFILGLATSTQAANPAASIGTVDVVPAQYQLGQELYLENCASCHIGIPPAIFPTQTWKNLIEDSQHYGVQIQPLVDPQRILVWKYLSTFSRVRLEDEATPYRFNRSRYFQALHPDVKLPKPLQVNSCVSCHPGASKYNFRSLTTEWE